MNLEAELILMEQVRETLMGRMHLNHDQVDYEINEEAPAMTGQFYCSIMPADGRIGNLMNNLATQHYVYGIRVIAHQRISDIGRDRRKRIAYERYRSINAKLTEISNLIAGNHGLMVCANQQLESEQVCGKFLKPLMPRSIDPRPKVITSDYYGGKRQSGGDPTVAIARGINFGGAEFIGNITE